MKKAENVKEFVERIDSSKKLNPKDLSSDQDLTIAVMNLISIEEHLVFSGAKTGKNSYYDLVEGVREIRKNLMQKLVPDYEGEVWCISKHLLSSSMRLTEVGTKQQSMGRKEEAYALFNQAYDLYCLFWGLNMKMVDVSDLKWIEDNLEDVKKLSAKPNDASPAPLRKETAEVSAGGGAFAKMKAFVKKAVDCCIE
jgi:hypothetical protein